MQRPSLEAFRQQEKLPIKVLLDDIRSLSNVGSIFRTCDGFEVDEVMLCGITGRPPHRDIQRTALGATESVKWNHYASAEETITQLKSDGWTILALEQCDQTIAPADLDESWRKVCLILGNEVSGIRNELIALSDAVVEIPQGGTKHSFNVTIAAGIALWELYKFMKKRG